MSFCVSNYGFYKNLLVHEFIDFFSSRKVDKNISLYKCNLGFPTINKHNNKRIKSKLYQI